MLSFVVLLGGEKEGMYHMVNKTRGIITLYRHQRAAFAITSKRGPAPKAPKTPPTELPPGSTLSTDNDEVHSINKEPVLHFSSYQHQVVVTVSRWVFILEQEAFSHSETRSRFLLNNHRQALRCRPYQVSAIPVGEHGGATEDGGNRKSAHWYDCNDRLDSSFFFTSHQLKNA